jgi:predicted nucleic acid-binding protein
MRILLDTSLLVEGERRNFDLGKWVVAARHEVFICDATIAEYLAGKPLKDAGKRDAEAASPFARLHGHMGLFVMHGKDPGS